MSEPWRDPNYGFRKEITVQDANLDADLTDFPLLVHFEADVDLGSVIREDLGDVRFYDGLGNPLKFEREYGNVAGGAFTADYWVRKPALKASPAGNDNKLWVYYGYGAAADGQDAANVWDANFAGVWHMTSDGWTEYDSTGNGEDLTQSGGSIPTAAGMVHTGRDFESSDTEHLEHADAGSTDLAGAGQAITVEAWIKQETAPGNVAVAGKWNASSNKQYLLRIEPTGEAAFYLSSDGSSATGARGGTNLSPGTWHHVAGVYDGTDVRVYRDGAVDLSGADNPKTYSAGIHDGEAPFRLGAWHDGTSLTGHFDGVIDEVRVSRIARAAEWIKFTYHNVHEADYELTWGAEETQGVTAIDGPYRVVAGSVWHPGAAAARCFLTGGRVGRVDTSGAIIGKIHA